MTAIRFLVVVMTFLFPSAYAWVPSRMTTTSYRMASVEEDISTTTKTAEETLLPEFAQALEMAQTKLLQSISPEMKTKLSSSSMLPLLQHFLQEYMTASQKAFLDGQTEVCHPQQVVQRILTAIQYGFQFGMGPNKYQFDVSHTALRGTEEGNTVDYYAFGCDFFRPVMNLKKSQVLGKDNLQQAMEQLQRGENVVLLANHQSEADPQVVSVCLELAGYAQQAADMVYVAGHKVTTDALAIPFSMGRNLICIHSKKHINADAETKPLKQKQNLKAMSAMLKSFKEGGTLLWVAPSGGRDRRDTATGAVPCAPFDSKTIDMFRLMGNKSGVPTHYYTLAMVSYDLCPPPDYVEAGTGEQRNVRYVPVGIHMGQELESVGGLESRKDFCAHAYEQCVADYETLLQAMQED
ncbi:glycerol-3-phosphate O-acyltransferase [Fistulifera solaris]|uniref:Glycerol-3-phosphate O-acyltransferase n=1 Tax=Fistulifera solaris TaxID=1519565 RepID=A0A1Z5JFN9_FISSO|nr:glycerol-3-phosphate O-acyltransferase [Fistulifera solaris]|eukprot:GAX12825.1 glycerol-3-phosphate O-acyltransferase [Fistulifera solaris]